MIRRIRFFISYMRHAIRIQFICAFGRGFFSPKVTWSFSVKGSVNQNCSFCHAQVLSLNDEAPGLSLPRISGELTHQGPIYGTTAEGTKATHRCTIYNMRLELKNQPSIFAVLNKLPSFCGKFLCFSLVFLNLHSDVCFLRAWGPLCHGSLGRG